MKSTVSAILFLVAARVSQSTSAPRPASENDISNICPSLFSYDPSDTPGQWSGTLRLESDEDLTGIWVRVVFDKPVVRVEAEGGFQVRQDENEKQQALVHNRSVLLKAHQELSLKITVKYDGDEAPNLIEYRLNARTKCPEYSTSPSDFYLGDFNSPDFLAKILATKKPQSIRCGAMSSSLYPWHASLFINERFVCEAILISDQHILVPAHCVTTKTGDRSISNKVLSVNLGDGKRGIKVAEVYVHSAGDDSSLSYNMAVLKLKEAVPISDSLMSICLDNSNEGILLVGFDVNDQNGNGSVQSIKAQKISDKECYKIAGDLANTLTDDTYCIAYEKGQSNCVGNSGSSFVSLENDQVYLKGFVSVGVKLQNKNECDENTVAVVTDTTRYSKWLERILVS